MRGTRNYVDALKLKRPTGTTKTLNTTTGEYETSTTFEAPWTGLGSLQPNLGAKPAVVDVDQGGTREVPIPYRAILPTAASPERGDQIEDATGRRYVQVTAPIERPDYWLLNLSEPRTPAS